ncbi:MAG: rod shape-determining protein RodA [Actinomycetes bacterium]
MSRGFKRSIDRDGFVRQLDLVLLGAVALLLVIGSFLVSASTRDWYASNGLDPHFYLKRHLINIIIGLVLAATTAAVDYRLLRAYTPVLWGLAVIGLIAVLIPGVGDTINGARAWISLPGGFSIQPAEFAKLAIIVGMAMVLAEKRDGEKDPRNIDVLQALGVAALPVLLIFVQPDVGTILVVSCAVLAIIAVSGAPARWIAGLLMLAVLGGVAAVQFNILHDYQLKRLQSFINPQADPQESGYQLQQARITIGSGGFLGKGLYKGPQSNGRFVPEQQTDFIFTVAGEELGFVGSTGIIALFGIILWRAGRLARRTTDLFGRLVVSGVMAWFAFQFFENVGMALGLMPMTGVPLPFLSYGGTSMFATLMAVGLLQNVHARRTWN